MCAYWTWYQLKKAKTYYSPAFFIATEATAAVGSLLVIMAIIWQWFDKLVEGYLVISSDIFFEIYLIYFIIILFEIYALTDQPGPLGCQDQGTFHRCIFLSQKPTHWESLLEYEQFLIFCTTFIWEKIGLIFVHTSCVNLILSQPGIELLL